MTVHLNAEQLATVLGASDDETLAGGRLQCLACAADIVWPDQWHTMREVYRPHDHGVRIARVHDGCDTPQSWTDDLHDPALPGWFADRHRPSRFDDVSPSGDVGVDRTG